MQTITIDNATPSDIPALVELLAELFSIEADFKPDTERQVSAQLVISTAQGTPSAWLEDMVVSPDYRSGGIGRQLLEAVQEWAKSKGATRAQLLVDTENLPAVGYYQHLGWEATQLQARRLFF